MNKSSIALMIVSCVTLYLAFLNYTCYFDETSPTGFCRVAMQKPYGTRMIKKMLGEYETLEEVVESWESLDYSNRKTTLDQASINKGLHQLISLFSWANYEKLRGEPNHYVYAVGNAAVLETISAIHRNDVESAVKAHDLFIKLDEYIAQHQEALNEDGWYSSSGVQITVNIFKIHLCAYMAVHIHDKKLSLDGKGFVEQQCKQKGNIKSHIGVGGLIRNSRTIENLIKAGLIDSKKNE